MERITFSAFEFHQILFPIEYRSPKKRDEGKAKFSHCFQSANEQAKGQKKKFEKNFNKMSFVNSNAIEWKIIERNEKKG